MELEQLLCRLPATKGLVSAYLGNPLQVVIPELATRLIRTPLVFDVLPGDRCTVTLYDSPEHPTEWKNLEISSAEALKEAILAYWASHCARTL